MDKTQKAGILLAVIHLDLPVLLYLSVLFAQLLTNYETWLAADGITGAATMPALNASPLFCVLQAFTATGLKGLIFLLLSCGGGIAYLLLRDRVGGKEYDPRNFRYSKEGTKRPPLHLFFAADDLSVSALRYPLFPLSCTFVPFFPFLIYPYFHPLLL